MGLRPPVTSEVQQIDRELQQVKNSCYSPKSPAQVDTVVSAGDECVRLVIGIFILCLSKEQERFTCRTRDELVPIVLVEDEANNMTKVAFHPSGQENEQARIGFPRLKLSSIFPTYHH